MAVKPEVTMKLEGEVAMKMSKSGKLMGLLGVVGAGAIVWSLSGGWTMGNRGGALFGSAVYADGPLTAERAQLDESAISHAEALARAFRTVSQVVEPSVVKIDAVRARQANAGGPGGGLGGQLPDMLRRMFPDRDGDGEPDVPGGFNFDFGPADPGPRREFGEGSGVIMEVGEGKAWILTNNHVAGGAEELMVTLADGRTITEARVIGTDPNTDLAVIEVVGEGLIAARWGNSDALLKGDIVLAFGSPFGYEGTITQGIVSALDRSPGIINANATRDQRGFSYEYFIQTDAAINPGNSGGPLVNLRGEVVGINTAIATRTGTNAGVGFSIPSNQAKFVYDSLRSSGVVVRGYLGVQIRDVRELTNEQRQNLGFASMRGTYVQQTVATGPAHRKLLPDDIITAIDGVATRDSRDLRTRIATMTPGTTVKLTVWRDRKSVEVEITLGTQPGGAVAQAAAARPQAPAAGALGIDLADATKEELERYGLDVDAKGALVVGVREASRAARYGIAVGELITAVNGEPVSSAEEAAKQLSKADVKSGIRLRLLNREGQRSVFIVER